MSFVPGHVVVEAPGGSATEQLFLLHGILGSSKNWRAFARQLVEDNPEWRVILVDLPAHGTSREAPGPYDLPTCAEHLYALARQVGAPRCLIGHSFGGKVAVQASKQLAIEPLGVAVLDCPLLALETETRTNSEVGRVVSLLNSIPLPLERRSQVSEIFTEAGFDRSLSGWMATNLRPAEGGGYVWHFKPEAISELLNDYWSRDYHGHLDAPAARREFLLVKAENSDRFGTEELDRTEALSEAGKVTFRTVENAGHWLHIDNPQGLRAILSEFLSQLL